MDPPERAVVLCVDEKSQIQALDRTAPILPMLPGTPERATHDYKRSGTSSLYAALDIANGKVIGSLHSRHRAIEFKKFLQTLDREVPRNLDVHLVLDNASTHKTPAVKRWLNAHPRFVLHFTPTSSSWLNLVELPVVSRRSRRAASGYASERETWRKDEMSDALLIPIAAVATGVVVIVVAVAVVLVVLFVTLSMRGRQRRGLKRRDETRQELAEAHERAARAERDRDIAQEQASQPHDPDR